MQSFPAGSCFMTSVEGMAQCVYLTHLQICRFWGYLKKHFMHLSPYASVLQLKHSIFVVSICIENPGGLAHIIFDREVHMGQGFHRVGFPWFPIPVGTFFSTKMCVFTRSPYWVGQSIIQQGALCTGHIFQQKNVVSSESIIHIPRV